MKLRTLIAISLVLYVFGATTITVIGLSAKPAATVKIDPVAVPALTIGAETSTTSEVDPTQAIIDASQSSTADASSDTSSDTSTQTQTTSSTTTPTTTSPVTTPKTSPTPTPTPKPTPTPTPTPTPAPTPVPTPIACGSAGGVCTAAQVATHGTAGNCWQIYNGGYYIVTSYVNKHNGGASVFNAQTCGHDITGYLNGSQSTAGKTRHHSSAAYTVLQSYYVGKVQG